MSYIENSITAGTVLEGLPDRRQVVANGQESGRLPSSNGQSLYRLRQGSNKQEVNLLNLPVFQICQNCTEQNVVAVENHFRNAGPIYQAV